MFILTELYFIKLGVGKLGVGELCVGEMGVGKLGVANWEYTLKILTTTIEVI